MVPTNRLRQVPIYRIITHNIRESTPTGYKLQQWWSATFFTSGNPRAPTPEHAKAKEFGEWRDVEIVEE